MQTDDKERQLRIELMSCKWTLSQAGAMGGAESCCHYPNQRGGYVWRHPDRRPFHQMTDLNPKSFSATIQMQLATLTERVVDVQGDQHRIREQVDVAVMS